MEHAGGAVLQAWHAGHPGLTGWIRQGPERAAGNSSEMSIVFRSSHPASQGRTLNWRKVPVFKNGNWFERRDRAYCHIRPTADCLMLASPPCAMRKRRRRPDFGPKVCDVPAQWRPCPAPDIQVTGES